MCVYTLHIHCDSIVGLLQTPDVRLIHSFSLYGEFLIHLALLCIMVFSETLEDNGTI